MVEKVKEADPVQIAYQVKLKVTGYMKKLKDETNRERKRLALLAWYYYSKAKRLNRDMMKGQNSVPKQAEKIIVKQKLEVVDGTVQVWSSVRGAIVGWIYSIFLTSNHHLNQKKK